MRTDTIPAPSSASRPAWPAMLFALVVLTGAFSLAGVAMPTTAHAATVVVNQCNDHGPRAEGATTGMNCTVTVVNTINGSDRSSTTTVTRLCTLGPCSTPNGTFTTRSNGLVTMIQQCNNSDTGNPGGSVVSCKTRLVTRITASAAAPTARTRTATKTRSATATPSVSSPAPSGELPAGNDSTDGPGLDGLLMLGAGLVLASSVGALLYRRFDPTNWPFIHRD